MKSQLSILVGLLMVTKEGTLDYVIHINGNNLLISMYIVHDVDSIYGTPVQLKKHHAQVPRQADGSLQEMSIAVPWRADACGGLMCCSRLSVFDLS